MSDKINEKAAARALLRAVQVLEDEFESDKIGLNQVAALLVVAAHEDRAEGLEVKDVQDITGLPSGTVSRNLSDLAEWGRTNQGRGLRLVEMKPRLDDRRRKRVTLTDDGRKLLKRLRSEMQKEIDR